MDQNTARRLLVEGGIFVFLNVPKGTEFGIDMKSWNTEENFRGVKMIPPGLHYIFYSSVSSTGDTAPRVGFFHNFKKSEILVRKWDAKTEDLSEEPVKEEEVVGLRDNLMFLDKFLGPYPYDILDKWNSLSSHIDVKLSQKLAPANGKIRSALEMSPCSDADRPRGKKRPFNSEIISSTQDECSTSTKNLATSIGNSTLITPLSTDDSIHENESSNAMEDAPSSSNATSDLEKRLSYSECENLLPELKAKPGTEVRFTKIPDRKYPEGSTPNEITKHCLDRTFLLDRVIATYDTQTDILGEIEFAYICFLVGHSLEAFDHWKSLVCLMCSCDVAIKKYRHLYDDFVTILEAQVREIPEEFLADIVSNNNFIYVKLRDLFRAIGESDVDGRLKNKVQRFQETLTADYGWDFTHLDSEDEDDLPVLVEDVEV